MSFFEYSIILFPFLFVISFLIFLNRSQNKNYIIPTSWPVLGMFPTALVYVYQPHDYITDLLRHNGGTFLYKGPWLTNMDMLGTSNPLDIHHIMSKNFPNYSRSHKFRKSFDIVGDGFSNTDGHLWEFQRRTIKSLLKLHSFKSLLENTIWNKVENGLLLVLDYISKERVEIDLQDVFQRFAFDTTCMLFLDHDPKSMSTDFPHVPCEKALSDIGEAILHRYILPASFLKLLQLLRIGREKKLANAWKTIDQFIYKFLEDKDEKEFGNTSYGLQDDKFKLSTALIRELKDQNGTLENSNKFLRDNLLNLLIAGRDTTSTALSWFFYLVVKNPIIEDNIREELHTKLAMEMTAKWKHFNTQELSKLVYLHGALCEALRLFPPVPFQEKAPLRPDILPSGHQVDHNTKIILSYYTMGRMKSIWGEDCMEFKPERWVSTDGRIIHQPSYKFPAFNVGPRTCLGKDTSLTHLKIVAATIIYHYHVELVEGHPVFPSDSIILKMKKGLKVRLTKRSEAKI